MRNLMVGVTLSGLLTVGLSAPAMAATEDATAIQVVSFNTNVTGKSSSSLTFEWGDLRKIGPVLISLGRFCALAG